MLEWRYLMTLISSRRKGFFSFRSGAFVKFWSVFCLTIFVFEEMQFSSVAFGAFRSKCDRHFSVYFREEMSCGSPSNESYVFMPESSNEIKTQTLFFGYTKEPDFNVSVLRRQENGWEFIHLVEKRLRWIRLANFWMSKFRQRQLTF